MVQGNPQALLGGDLNVETITLPDETNEFIVLRNCMLQISVVNVEQFATCGLKGPLHIELVE